MGKDEARIYRQAVKDLIVAQNRELPLCPYDGKPCDVPDMSCEVTRFGVMASDGVEEVVWSCPRLKKR